MVKAAVTILNPIPVVRVENVANTCVPANDPLATRLSKLPVVVPVSTEVELICIIEPPDAITLVVWVKFAPKPVVMAFMPVISRAVPVVIEAALI